MFIVFSVIIIIYIDIHDFILDCICMILCLIVYDYT
jgi:hypothetical protein